MPATVKGQTFEKGFRASETESAEAGWDRLYPGNLKMTNAGNRRRGSRKPATFRDHVLKMAKEGDGVAELIAADHRFPYAPENPDAYAAYLKAQRVAEEDLYALDDLWDGYRFGKPQLETWKIHDCAKMLVETFNHYCVVTVNRDMLVDYLQCGFKLPAEAALAEKEIPGPIKAVLEAFKPVTLSMFTRLKYRGPWTHDTGPRYYNLHVPIDYKRVTVNAMRAAELYGLTKPLEALLVRVSAEVSEDTAIYLWSDTQGVPIYYGITKDMHARQTRHARYGSWGAFAHSCRVERAATRDEALALEKDLIRRDRPIFNRQHNNSPEAYARLVEYLTRHGRLDLMTAG